MLFLALVVLATIVLFTAWRTLRVSAAPDEWLLLIRDGRLVEAGVGVTRWRRPGDVLARFSSTMQRVGYDVRALTAERLEITIGGFVLWSVSPAGDGPFRAFRSLGLANLLHPPADLKHPKHLLTGPQHRAFQQIVVATVQRHASTLSLAALLADQDAFVHGLTARLRDVLDPLGAALNQVQVLAARPVEAALLKDLGASDEQRIREEAARVRLDSATRQAAHEGQAGLALEQQRARLLAEKEAVRMQQLASDHAVKVREQEIARTEELLVEARTMAVVRARHEREQLEIAFAGDKLRRQAEAQRDAGLALLAVEERKPQAVRDQELGRLAAEKIAQAVKITDAKWITIGNDSPAAGLSALLAGMRELVAPRG